jgi:hypothetical protein
MICDHMVKSNFSLDKLFNNELMFFLIWSLVINVIIS